MIEPDFREPQLQQTVNEAFLLWRLSQDQCYIHPVVPTLLEEELLGWDSAFYFPWLLLGPHRQHYGCNFFLQYKISTVIEGHNGRQYADWGQPYYRFKIPHSIKHGGQYLDDYHQLHLLQSLAAQQYEVYYATNQVTSRQELFNHAEARTLLDNTPFLSVSDIHNDHHFVTFTPTSQHFFLYSEAEECRRHSFEMVSSRLPQVERRTLTQDNHLTFELLMPFLDELRGTRTFIKNYHELGQAASQDDADRLFIDILQWLMLRSGLRRFFDIDLMRLS